MEKWRSIRSKTSHQPGGVFFQDFGSENEDETTPMSFSIIVDSLMSIQSCTNEMKQSQKNLLEYIRRCCDIMPGFPGAGRSFIEIPIRCKLADCGIMVNMILEVFQNFTDSFKYDQIFEHYSDFVKTEKNSSLIIKKVDFLSCLPENGGSPQINISFRYNARGLLSLILVVDSYWQPAIDLFKKTYKKMEQYCFSENPNNAGLDTSKIKNYESLKAVYDDIKNTLRHEYSTELFSKIYQKEDADMDVNLNRIKKNLHFISANFSYCEYMSFIHRNAILTRLVSMISKLKDKNNQSILPDFEQILTNQYTLPSLSVDGCKVVDDMNFNLKDKPIFIQLIAPNYIKDSIHSTIRFVRETNELGNFQTMVHLSKRIFEKRDFIEGNVFIFYGCSEGGFYVPNIKTEKDIIFIKPLTEIKYVSSKVLESDKPRESECNLSKQFIYVSKSIFEYVEEYYELSSDILVHPWFETETHTQKSTQTTYGIDFTVSDFFNEKNNLENESHKILLFQPFFEEFQFRFPFYHLKNSFLIETSINEFIKKNFGMPIHVNIYPIFVSIWSCRSLQFYSLEDLIKMKKNDQSLILDKNGKIHNKILISPTHFTELEKFKKRKVNFEMKTTEKIYGDTVSKGAQIAYSSTSGPIIKKNQKMYTRTFTQLEYSYIDNN